MTATIRKIAYLPRTAREVTPEPSIPAVRIAAAKRQEEATSRVAFADAMDVAMTSLVLVGALLFGAGLVRYGAPAGQAREIAAAILYALAGFGGVLLAAFTLTAIFRRVAFLARRRG